jgi:hypothetical protein
MENQFDEIAGMKVYSSPEEMISSQPQEQAQPEPQPESQPEPQPEAQSEPTPQPEAQEVAQPQESDYVDPEAAPVQQETQEYSDSDYEEAVLSYLSERLGREFSSFDDLSAPQQNALDERIEAIARFVQDTGRNPEDWFAYQSLNPSEMDDMTAIRVSMASEYPSLSADELNVLVQSKYKVDPDLNTEDEVRLSMIQLKVDAQNARQKIEELRSQYSAPETSAPAVESIVDDEWVSNMSKEVDLMTGLEFDLGGDKSFTFGLDDRYKSQLKEKNARLDEYFDPYIREDGSWDYDMLSSHRAVVDNIDAIVASAYKQGLGDGQRTLVDKAANVQSQAPVESGIGQSNPLADQLKSILGGQSSKMTFKI